MLGPDEVVDVISRGVANKDEVIPQEIQQLYGIIPRTIFEIFHRMN